MTIDQRFGRPSGTLREWASDDLWVAPAQSWDGAPAKVSPSNGFVAQGFLPGAHRPADYDNYLFNLFSRMLRRLDVIEACCWPDSGELTLTPNSGGAVAGWMASSIHLADHVLYYCNAGTDLYGSADGGVSWVSAVNDAGAAIHDVDANEAAIVAVATEGGDAKVIYHFATGSWTTTALTNSDDCREIATDPYQTNIAFVAGINGTTPRVWRLDFSGGALAQTNLSAGAGTTRLDVVACSPTYKLAAALNVASTSNCLYRWLDGDSSLTGVTAPTNLGIRDVIWSHEDGVFYLIADNGSGSFKLYRSATGATGTWTDVSAAFPTTALKFGDRCMCVRGGILLLAGMTGANVPYIMMSADAAASFQLLPDPCARTGGGGDVVEHLVAIGNRMVAMGYAGGGQTNVAYSIRAGLIR